MGPRVPLRNGWSGPILFLAMFGAWCWSGCDGDVEGDAEADADAEGDGDGDADSDVDTDADADADSDADVDADSDADSDVDTDADADSDADDDDDIDPMSCGEGGECTLDSECTGVALCSGERCEPIRWPPTPGCSTDWDRCVGGSFPDPCWTETMAGAATCPSRPERIRPPSCFSFLELGAPGPEDDEVVLRLVHDLWAHGQASSTPPRPKVVMAVGDSISESMAYISASALDCLVPDFAFSDGYRLVGQPGLWDVPQTAMSGETAEWGLTMLRTQPWFEQIRPEVATVLFGTNELWTGWLGLQEYVSNLRGIIDELLAHDVIPILMTPPPGTYPISRDRQICGVFCEGLTESYEVADFAQAVRDLAAERRLPLVDLYARFTEFDRPGFEALLADGVHPCYREDCPSPVDVSGSDLRDDAVLRMYKFLELRAMTRCPGAVEPSTPPGYHWDDSDPAGNFRGEPPRSYCPDPVISSCGGS